MDGSLRSIFGWLLHLGGAGVFVMGVLDSSFLFLPLGNDLLVTALALRDRGHIPLYVLLASSGSCVGVLVLDFIARRGGEAALEKLMNRRRRQYLKRKMEAHAAIPVVLACIAPPPFPFTPVVAAASAFNYPRLRLLGIVLAGRTVRFTGVALLALAFGREFLKFAKTNTFVGIMITIVVLSIGGSVVSIIRWIRQSRRA
jgi:membrane protein YqaA with SNARE-associated domain